MSSEKIRYTIGFARQRSYNCKVILFIYNDLPVFIRSVKMGDNERYLYRRLICRFIGFSLNLRIAQTYCVLDSCVAAKEAGV